VGMHVDAPGGAWLIGRETELEAIGDFVSSDSLARALLFTGAPGIGKTALWEAGVGLAYQQGFRVLTARPTEAEALHSFAGLFDLLESVRADTLAELPGPQRRGLEVALLRSDPDDIAPDPFAIAAGLLGVLRNLAATEALLVAVDDLQWLDPASADALAFAARRLDTQQCRFLFAMRDGDAAEVEAALAPDDLRRLDVRPLSVEGTYRLLAQRLGLTLAPRPLQRLFAATHGIPLLVLEMGQILASRDVQFFEVDLPIPEPSANPFETRVRGLDRPDRQALLAVILSGQMSRQVLESVADAAAMESLVAAGLLILDGGRVRLSHPLLAAAVRKSSRAADRRLLHRELAASAQDETIRARHLALATTGTDERLAGVIAAAADRALRRGAAHDAVDLAEHAVRLTPPAAADRPDRLLALAEYLLMVGEPVQARELITPSLGEFPPGAARARAHLLLADAGILDEHQYHLELALAESEQQPELRAIALGAKAVLLATILLERIEEAQACAEQARALVTSCGAAVEREVLQALAWVRVMRGMPLDDLVSLPVDHESPGLYENTIDRQIGIRLAFRGQIGQARQVFSTLEKLADERGEARFRAAIQLQQCEVELRAGDVRECTRLADQRHLWAALDDLHVSFGRCEAMIAAVRGDPQQAERLAASVAAMATASHDNPGPLWDELEARRAGGVAALLAQQPEQAAEALGAVWKHTQREGINDPGAFPAAPDLVEALIALGRLTEATAVTTTLRDLAENQQHPWGLATADRCAAAITLASGYDEDAADQLAAAAAALGDLGLAFDRARSLLWLGRAARRVRKRSVARDYLEAARTAFAELGCDGWAEQARAEMARLGARRSPRTSELTAAEQRVAALAAEGLSNKQIAAQLFIAVHTVEVHLAHVYAKLDVRSRTQLANRLARPPGPDPGD
jgi:DNA-binding CsgD family transcriptional regulator